MPGTIPGGRHRFVLTLNNDLSTRCLIMDATTRRERLLRRRRKIFSTARLHDRGSALYDMSSRARCTGACPSQRRSFYSSAHGGQIVSVVSGGGSSTHTLSVPPSADRLFVGVNLATAGTTKEAQDGHDQFEPSLSVLQVQYAGQTLPNTVVTTRPRLSLAL